MDLISCVLIALRLGPINCSCNMKWAGMHRIMLCYIISWLEASFVCLRYLRQYRLLSRDMQLAACVAHPPINKGMSSMSPAPCIFFCLPERRVDLPGCSTPFLLFQQLPQGYMAFVTAGGRISIFIYLFIFGSVTILCSVLIKQSVSGRN